MEMEKRKRSADGEADGRRARIKEDEGDLPAEQTATATATATATDEEVEEFFAILRRVHEVVRYFGKGKRGEGEREGAAKREGERWKPSFQWEDFEEMNGNSNKGRKKREAEAVEENHVMPVVLDLNAEPEPVVELI